LLVGRLRHETNGRHRLKTDFEGGEHFCERHFRFFPLDAGAHENDQNLSENICLYCHAQKRLTRHGYSGIWEYRYLHGRPLFSAASLRF
jgi:hypothetical protein